MDDRIIVKVTFPFVGQSIQRQLPDQNPVMGHYEFRVNDETCTTADYWVVFDGLLKKEKVMCPKDHVILMVAETSEFKVYNQEFLAQFAHLITCQRNISHPQKHYVHQGHPWWVNKNYDELAAITAVPKQKKISVITSNKQITKGHQKRFEFCHRLKDALGDDIDLFGRGIQDFEDKWDVVAPYEYSVTIENDYLEDWFTEKIYDCFLAHTLPLYYGCPNLDRYFPSEATIRIDLNNFEDSLRVIERTIGSSEAYHQRLPYLIESKKRYMEQYSFFPLIMNFIGELQSNDRQRVKHTLQKEELFKKSRIFRLFS